MTRSRSNSVPRLLAILLAIAVLALSCSDGQEGSPAPDRGLILIVPEILFDGQGFHEGMAVLVEGEHVTAVGPASELRSPGMTELRVEGTVLPGFIDLHVHASSVTSEALLSKGLTTVRDLAEPAISLPPPDPAPGTVRRIVAGPIITAPGGYPIGSWGRAIAKPVSSPEEAAAAVDDLHAAGAGVIKTALEPGGDKNWPMLGAAELRALVREAHEQNLRVTVHVEDGVLPVKRALAVGIDEFAHMPCRGQSPALIRQIAEAGVPVVATLDVQHSSWCEDNMRNARIFVAAGGKLLYGSDMGNPGIPAGIDVEELELMEEAGLSLEAVLRAATADAGKALGLAPLGVIAPGAPADLIAVNGDIREDLRTLWRPVLVISGGVVVVNNLDKE